MKYKDARRQELTDFLKTRRAKIQPSDVGIQCSEHRRTPGLRREEVAQLAGIGLTWYTWLEQGRPIHVSEQILESLSHVFQLNSQERTHLFELAQQPIHIESENLHNTIPNNIKHLLDQLTLCPSYVIDEYWNVLAWNKAASLVFEEFEKLESKQRNLVWMMFLDNNYKKLFENWAEQAKGMLAHFRLNFGENIDEPSLNELVEMIRHESTEFNTWWPLHDVYLDDTIYKNIIHPVFGTMCFEFSSFIITNHPELKLVVHNPCDDTFTNEKMKLLLGILQN